MLDKQRQRVGAIANMLFCNKFTILCDALGKATSKHVYPRLFRLFLLLVTGFFWFFPLKKSFYTTIFEYEVKGILRGGVYIGNEIRYLLKLVEKKTSVEVYSGRYEGAQ